MKLTETQLAEIMERYGYEFHSLVMVVSGYRNSSHVVRTSDGHTLNFILYKDESGIVDLVRRTNALGAFVKKTTLPVRAPVDTRILKLGSRYGALYDYLEGETIPWEAYTMKHIKLLGFAMAQFHAVASEYDGPALPDVEVVYQDIAQRMKRYFADDDVLKAVEAKLHFRVELPEFTTLLTAAQHLHGRTPLHMDLVRSNILFRLNNTQNNRLEGLSLSQQVSGYLPIGNVEVTGILDLEKAAVGHPLFDVARTLAFLLVDCAKPEEKIRRYFLDSGYRKRGGRVLRPVRIGGEDLLEGLVTLFLIYDLYKFLRQNPYESLPENHHFVRTRDILLRRKVLQLTE